MSNQKHTLPFIRIPFARPTIGKEELAAVERVMKSGWLTTAGESMLFEKEFLSFVASGTDTPPTALAVQSATAGLHLCFEAFGIGKDDEVITSPFTFASTASTIILAGARPIFVDCAKDSLHPGVNEIEALSDSPRHKAFVPVHIAGTEQDPDVIDVAKQRGLLIIEDAAHAFPARGRRNKRLLGTGHDAGVFSFYANKTITTAEGGMVVCQDETIARRIASLRNHGITRSVWDRYRKASRSLHYDIAELGYKYNLPDVLAAIGREQLKKAASFHKQRARAARMYMRHLAAIPYIRLPFAPEDDAYHSWHLFVVRFVHPSLTRDDFAHRLARRGIGTSVHYRPLHLMSYYKNRFQFRPSDFPNALQAFHEVLSLPIYPGITESEIEEVCATIRDIGD